VVGLEGLPAFNLDIASSAPVSDAGYDGRFGVDSLSAASETVQRLTRLIGVLDRQIHIPSDRRVLLQGKVLAARGRGRVCAFGRVECRSTSATRAATSEMMPAAMVPVVLARAVTPAAAARNAAGTPTHRFTDRQSLAASN